MKKTRPRHIVVVIAGLIAVALIYHGISSTMAPDPAADHSPSNAADHSQSTSGADRDTPPKAADQGQPAMLSRAWVASGSRSQSAYWLDTTVEDHDQAYQSHPLGDAIRAVLKDNIELAIFDHYYKHPLLSDADQAKYRAMLSDPAMIEWVQHDLTLPDETKATMRGNVKRLMEVDYLRAALSWKENPQRDAIATAIEDAIVYDNMFSRFDMEMKEALSTVKLELVALLFEHYRHRIPHIVERVQGTRVEKLVAFLVTHAEAGEKLAQATAIRP